MDEITLTLNNPLTEEEWDLIEDVDFDKTNSIEFHTKHGKTVKFVKCTDERTGDTISRRQAIDALGDEPEVWTGKDEYAQGLNNQWHYDVNALKTMPSAQPQDIAQDIARIIENEKDMRVISKNAQPDIILCKDCKHRDPENKKCDSGHFIRWQLPRDDDWFCADAERREE